jgi:hypothetical protein
MLMVTVTFQGYNHVVRNISQCCPDHTPKRATKKFRMILKRSCKVLKTSDAHLGYI